MEKKVEITSVQNLSSSFYRYLYQLNFRNQSPMQKRFSMARKGLINGHVVVCYQAEEVLGWVLIWYEKNHYIKTPIAYFYVKKKCRRQGVGSLLIKTAYGFCKNHYKQSMSVWVHDEVSEGFFSNVHKNITRYS
jgi:GNAT superfamily N-acetyltransferase